MGKCPPEWSARAHLAPSSPKLSPGLWRAVGWRLRVHRYCVLSENGLDWVGATRGPSSCQCYRHTPSPCLHVAYSLTGEKEAQQTVRPPLALHPCRTGLEPHIPGWAGRLWDAAVTDAMGTAA